MGIKGEVITTPYTFVATAHALLWNNIKPVFVDVDPVYGNLDPSKIEEAITLETTAILPVHVYGHPAEVEKIKAVAKKHELPIIYDAAHAFGINYKGQSILNFVDLSILSFHATKVFNTLEGGAIISHHEKMKKQIDYLKNFGFSSETKVITTGINAKMNEVQAAFGFLQLKSVKEQIEKRRNISMLYKEELKDVKGIRLLNKNADSEYNYSYFPIFIDENSYGMSRDQLYNKLKENGVYGRRYFYPLVTDFPMYRDLKSAKPDNLPNGQKISNEVICLPIYPGLEREEAKNICSIIKKLYA